MQRGFTADEMRAAWIAKGREFWCNVYRKRIGPPYATRAETLDYGYKKPLYRLHVCSKSTSPHAPSHMASETSAA